MLLNAPPWDKHLDGITTIVLVLAVPVLKNHPVTNNPPPNGALL
jgi:hypothetical protein